MSARAERTALITLDWSRVARIVASCALLAVFAFSRPLEGRGHISDVDATTYPAWVFVDTGTFELSGHQEHSHWFVSTESGVYSNRSPGAIGFATLGYLAAKPWSTGYSTLPGTVVAVLTSWLAVVLVAASAERLRPGLWIPTLVFFGLGTATWSISANQLWPHGPAQLMVALAVWLLIAKEDVASGLAFAIAVLVRPPTVLLGMGVGITKAIRDRSWRPLWAISGPPAVAAGAFVVYGRIVFGSWSPVASYESVGGFYGLTGLGERVVNWLSALVLPRHGVLVWSAWVLLCLAYSYRHRLGGIPNWLSATPLIAAMYVVVHSSLEVASGALPYNYRYPLEAVTLCAPFILAAMPNMTRVRLWRMPLLLTGWLAVFLQGAFVFLSRCWLVTPELAMCSLFG
ncbi:MAG TPA: hypothetical protein VG872_11955 [Acidimicrobiia bacterium]|nr:hypothetical protein [Acidimicrobiia bacterium]